MEMQEMKMTKEESQEENKGTEERKQDDTLLEEKKVESEYTGLNIPTENIYSEPSHPHPSATSLTDLKRRVRLYRWLCVILAVLSLILSIGIGILGATRRSQTVCQDEMGIPGVVPVPKSCTESQCRHVCLVKEWSSYLCTRCDAGWQEFEGSCFYLSRDLCTWGVCREKCKNMAGDLAVVDNQRLQAFLVKRGNLAYWIGVIQAKTGEAVWVNGRGTESSYWDQRQIEGQCGYLIGKEEPTRGWHKSPCAHQTAYICQK